MELLNILSFIFINIAFFGAIIFLFLITVILFNMTEDLYRAAVLALLWLILIAVLAGVGAYITY